MQRIISFFTGARSSVAAAQTGSASGHDHTNVGAVPQSPQLAAVATDAAERPGNSGYGFPHPEPSPSSSAQGAAASTGASPKAVPESAGAPSQRIAKKVASIEAAIVPLEHGLAMMRMMWRVVFQLEEADAPAGQVKETDFVVPPGLDLSLDETTGFFSPEPPALVDSARDVEALRSRFEQLRKLKTVEREAEFFQQSKTLDTEIERVRAKLKVVDKDVARQLQARVDQELKARELDDA